MDPKSASRFMCVTKIATRIKTVLTLYFRIRTGCDETLPNLWNRGLFIKVKNLPTLVMHFIQLMKTCQVSLYVRKENQSNILKQQWCLSVCLLLISYFFRFLAPFSLVPSFFFFFTV
jgi:hypothetical protein